MTRQSNSNFEMQKHTIAKHCARNAAIPGRRYGNPQNDIPYSQHTERQTTETAKYAHTCTSARRSYRILDRAMEIKTNHEIQNSAQALRSAGYGSWDDIGLQNTQLVWERSPRQAHLRNTFSSMFEDILLLITLIQIGVDDK